MGDDGRASDYIRHAAARFSAGNFSAASFPFGRPSVPLLHQVPARRQPAACVGAGPFCLRL